MEQTVILQISGMHCASCASNIEFTLEEKVGVKKAKVDFTDRKAQVEYDDTVTSDADLAGVIKEMGYTAGVI